ALYLAALFYYHNAAYNDPGSLFFNPAIAYTRHYSELRRQQAEEYMNAALSPISPRLHANPAFVPELCIGIASTTQDPARNIDFAIGSILEGLSTSERERLHIAMLVDGVGPPANVALLPPWLSNLVDEVLIDDGISSHDKQDGVLNHFYHLLEACQRTQAPYTSIFSQNIIAMDGWLHRTLTALDVLESKTTSDGRTPEDFLYLSLFYSESSLGWRWGNFTSYLLGSTVFFIVVASSIFTLRRCYPSSKAHLTPKFITAVLVICAPLIIALYFAAGRVTMLPPEQGVSKETPGSRYSQGLVLPQEEVEKLLEWQKTHMAASVVDLFDQIADERGETGWVLRPAVIQHIGPRHKNSEPWSQESTADRVFNFAFEHNDAEALRREHAQIA
ncbi:hypothetical protein DOTSEDRAFT_97617, partial [Dothistroma septosporum NZE10]